MSGLTVEKVRHTTPCDVTASPPIRDRGQRAIVATCIYSSMSFNAGGNYCNSKGAEGKLLTYATEYSITVHSRESAVQRCVEAGAPLS